MSLLNRKWLIALCVLSLTAGYGPVFADTHNHTTEKNITIKYRCPMHPWIVSDKPGECPICHMRLVLIDTPANPTDALDMRSVKDHVSVAIQKAGQNLVNVRTEKVKKMPLQKTLETWGMVAHDPELYQLQIEFLRQERLNYERERNRTGIAQKRGLTEREKIALQFLERGLSREWVKALEDAGVPDKRLIYHHEVDGIWVYLELREKEALLVKPKDIVSLWPTTLPDRVFQGSIEFINTMVQEETKTVRIHVLVKGSHPELKPNSSVSAKILIDLGEGLIIPEEAVLFTGEKSLVFVKKENTFEPREILLGQKVKGHYEVKSGLETGEFIASSGNFFIDSESRLRSSTLEASVGGDES